MATRQEVFDYMKAIWNTTKEKMKADGYQYKTLEEAKDHYEIFECIYQVYSEEFTHSCRDYQLKAGSKATKMIGEPSCELEAFMPDKDKKPVYCLDAKNKSYGYYVIPYDRQTKEDSMKACLKEMHLEDREQISTCDFENTRKLKLAKLIDDTNLNLKLAEDYFKEDCQRIKFIYGIHGGTSGKKAISEIYSYNIMLNVLLTSDIFCPVEGTEEEREFHHEPFRLFSDYLERIGYDGILYQSHLDPNGKCIVIFHPETMQVLPDTLSCHIDVKNL
ncbi:RES family NAD+ phosphorylase [Anaerosporobacter faecicola]|uniref:RES family NAD+ phosphorylase n=1 Tax=Anaerosporobacter faecicola TaxID=2718714 RepID=UPI00143A35D2|nr:RES family NAD+ phosphorylase [Anaerosporobacter faecicola]